MKRNFRSLLARLLAPNKNNRREKTYEAHGWDVARDNPADAGSWRFANALSMTAAADAQTRKIIRNRARYVVENNAYCAGAASAIVSAVAGTTPRLQLSDETVDSSALTAIENDFTDWADYIGLVDKLRVMRHARLVDGETFAVFFTNPTLNLPSGVTLDIAVVDCARVSATYGDAVMTPDYDDGITFDKYGQPTSYRILDYNPGDNMFPYTLTATEYPAANVCHWFKQYAPEQRRGVSELVSCLELFNLIDRYSKAVVQASETAADLAIVLKTDAVDDEAASLDLSTQRKSPVPENRPFVQFPWGRGTTMTLPDGWDAKQISAEQPSNSYGMLVDEILAQIGSGINVPKLLMKNSAENYNYSSARVDLQNFQNAVRLDRDSLVRHVLDPIWRAWYREYRAAGSLKINPRTNWYFDGFYHVDPLKEANAQIARVNNGLSSLASEYGGRGQDWERELRQIARERGVIKELEEEYGVTILNKTNDSATVTPSVGLDKDE